MDRKVLIKSRVILGTGLPIIGCLNDITQVGGVEANWLSKDVAHNLPTVNDNRILVSTSFKRVVKSPKLKVGHQFFKGR